MKALIMIHRLTREANEEWIKVHVKSWVCCVGDVGLCLTCTAFVERPNAAHRHLQPVILCRPVFHRRQVRCRCYISRLFAWLACTLSWCHIAAQDGDSPASSNPTETTWLRRSSSSRISVITVDIYSARPYHIARMQI